MDKSQGKSREVQRAKRELYDFYMGKPEVFEGDHSLEQLKLTRQLIDGRGGTFKLYYTKITSKQPRKATLLWIHGFGEHSTRYLDVAATFALDNYEVHLIDLRGFGHSGGPRFHGSMEEFHQDIEILLSKAAADLPLFVFGHSMGGGLISAFLMSNPGINVAGVILSAPYVGISKEDKDLPWNKKLPIYLVADDLGEIIINSGLNTSSLTKDPDTFRRNFDDSLLLPLMTIRLAKTFIQLEEYLIRSAAKFSAPVLILQGKKDRIIDHRDVTKFFNRIASKDKVMKTWEMGVHEMLMDIERDEVVSEMLLWLNQKQEKAKPLGTLPSRIRYGVPIKWHHIIPKAVKIKILLALIYVLLMLIAKKLYKFQAPMKVLFWPIAVWMHHRVKK